LKDQLNSAANGQQAFLIERQQIRAVKRDTSLAGTLEQRDAARESRFSGA
jgi:hypothetical protein